MIDIDVALVPAQAHAWPRSTVCIVIDELRASSTITTLLDLGCGELFLTRALAEARRLRRERGSFLVGERGGRTPRGFDFNNSPALLARSDVRGRSGVLCTSNGTAVLGRLRSMAAVVVGCLLNAGASAEAAIRLAGPNGRVGVVCAGNLGAFALDDAVAAGVIVRRLVEATGGRAAYRRLNDAGQAVVRLAGRDRNVVTALRESVSGQLVRELGFGDDVDFCARIDVSRTVPILRPGTPLRVERLPEA